MKGKKIALFMLPLLTQGGGAEKYFIELARYLGDHGYDADVVTLDEQFFKKFARMLHIFVLGNFFRKVDVGGREKEESVRRRLGSAKWLKVPRKNLGKTLANYDAIYSKNEIVDLMMLKMIGYKKIPPVVIGVHTPIFYPRTDSFMSKLHNFLYAGAIYGWMINGARCFHVSNQFTEEFVNKKFGLKSKLVYYPFSVGEIDRISGEKRSAINFDSGKINIIFIGRLSEQKGVGRLASIIESISKNQKIAQKIKINIFGSGTPAEEALVKGLENKFGLVKYFGHIPHDYVPSLLKSHQLMIATSSWEILPYTILEAQGLGLPVIAFDIPGPSDIVKNGETGFLVKNEKEFLEKIVSFVEGKYDFDREKIIGRIREKFDPEKIYGEMIKLFENT